MLKDLSIVILNYNSYNDTISCTNSILKTDSGIHIIIVDNMSPDASYSKLLNYYNGVNDVTVLQSDKNGGYSYGNNFGIKYAMEHFKSKYIGIINPDIIIIDNDIFSDMCKVLEENEKLAVVGGLIVDKNNVNSYNYNRHNTNIFTEEAFWNIPSGIEIVKNHCLLIKKITKRSKMKTYHKMLEKGFKNDLMQVDCVKGCFFIAKTKILIEVGFLDENVFLYNEENILGIKCKRYGYIEGVLTNKFYIHNHINNNNKSLTKKINATNNVYMSTKYMCKAYYSNILLPFLAMAEMLNKIYLFLVYLKNKLLKNVHR